MASNMAATRRDSTGCRSVRGGGGVRDNGAAQLRAGRECRERCTGCKSGVWAVEWACLSCDERVVHLAHGKFGVGDA